MKPRCWVVEQGLAAAGSCSGELVKAHLIPKQRMKREFDARRARLRRGGVDAVREVMLVPESMQLLVIWDSRVWVPVCGGPMGNGGHHGQLDFAGVNRLRIPREKLPVGVEQFARIYGLEWSLEADYGMRGAA